MADYTSATLVASAFDITTTDFAALEAAVAASTAVVDTLCGRNFDQTAAATTRVFIPTDQCYCPVDDVIVDDDHTIVVKTDSGYDGSYATTWTADTDYLTDPLNGLGPNGHDGWPVTGLRVVGTKWFPTSGVYRNRTVSVTGTFGWAEVPADIQQAALFLAGEMFKARDVPFGTAAIGEFAVRIQGNKRIFDLVAPYRTLAAVGAGNFVIA